MRMIGLTAVLALGLVIAPLAVEAQQTRQVTKVPRVGIIGSNTLTVARPAFLEGFCEHGWVDGQNIRIEWREAEGKPERIPALVRELVALPVDVIVANSFAGVLEATRASHVIPIVLAGGADFPNLTRAGLAQSIARPGGAVTGILQNPGDYNYFKKSKWSAVGMNS